MSELQEAKSSFLQAVGSSSGMPGMNDLNLACAAAALIRAERADPASEEAEYMRRAFAQLRRQDVYEAVKAILDDPQP